MLTALQLMRLRGDTAVERERIVIERQTRHLVRLVDDLLDVSRIARGKIDLRLERADLRHELESGPALLALDETTWLAAERVARLHVEASSEQVVIAQLLEGLARNGVIAPDLTASIGASRWVFSAA